MVKMQISGKKVPEVPLLGLGRIITAPPYLSSSLYPDNSSLPRIKSANGDPCLYLSYAFFHNVHDVLTFRFQPSSIISLAALSTGIPFFLDINRPFQTTDLLHYSLVSASHQIDFFLIYIGMYTNIT